MRRIPVALGERRYAIAVADSYARLPQELAALGLGPHGWVVSHERLLRRHGPALMAPLRRAGWSLTTVTVPESERTKSLAMLERVVTRIARDARMRVPVLLAFGGGVVGDLTGLVAALFRRGVPYVQLPTTLLAQVDSAIGGKVAVDLPAAKNILGAFYQPRLVWNNVSLLRTLPPRQVRSGLAEVIKYGVIADAALFEFLESHLAECLALSPRAVRVMVERSCWIKARVVAQDERESTGARAQLNFGHTLGHALETATGYRRWTHGEAIAIGMCAAAELGLALGVTPRVDAERIIQLIQAAGLPSRSRGVSARAVRRALRYDKKFIRGIPRWVLALRVGRVAVTERIDPKAAERVLSRCL